MFSTSACIRKIASTTLLFWAFNGFSQLDPQQQKGLDSLNNLIDQFENCSDTTCIDATLTLGKVYLFMEYFDSAQTTYHQVIEQLNNIPSKKLTRQHLRLKAQCYSAFGNFYGSQFDFKKAAVYYQKSLVLSEELIDIEGIVHNLNDLMELAIFSARDSLMHQVMAKVHRIHSRIQRPLYLAYNWETIGRFHERTPGDMDSSILAHTKALDTYKRLGKKKRASKTLSRLGVLYGRKDNMESSSAFLYEALKIEEELNRPSGVINNKLILANLHSRQHRYAKAQELLSSVLTLSTTHGFHNQKANILLQMGMNYHKMNELNKAEKHIELCNSLVDSLHLGSVPKSAIYMQLGVLAKKRGDLADALKYALRGLEFNTNNTQAIISQNLHIGKLYFELNNAVQAKQYLLKGLEMSKKHSLQTELQKIYWELHRIYSHENDYRKSLLFFKQSTSIKDSLDNLKGAEILIQKEAEYQIAKKEQELILEKKTSALLKQEKKTRNYMILGLSLVVLTGLLAFLFFFQRKRFVALQANNKIILQLHEIDGLKSRLHNALMEGNNPSNGNGHINDHLDSSLSQRELEVLHELIQGKANKEISESLCISVNTVTTHLKKIYSKLEVSNRTQAVSKASKLGF